MNNLAIVSIIIGILLIIGRGPLIFAPAATLRVIRKIVNQKSNLRLLGIPTSLLGVTMITSSLDSNQPFTLIILIPGCLILLAGLSEIFITSSIQRIAIYIWSMSEMKARVLGLFSVVLGVCFIYLGLAVF